MDIFPSGPSTLNARVETVTPMTSMERFKEGLWLSRAGLSPYAGSIYHGSPLLLPTLGAAVDSNCSWAALLLADILGAWLLFKLEQHSRGGAALKGKRSWTALWWLAISAAANGGTSTVCFENLAILGAILAAQSGSRSRAALAWILSVHFSLTSAPLAVPLLLLLLQSRRPGESPSAVLLSTVLWAAAWGGALLLLCWRVLGSWTRVGEMLGATAGFELSVGDVSPNVGLTWYFFAQVFPHFRRFFLCVFHGIPLSLLGPLSLCLARKPRELAVLLLALRSLLRPYPSMFDLLLVVSLTAAITKEDIWQGTRGLFLGGGILYTLPMGPVTYDMWIWRGSGNANFYFGSCLVYGATQAHLILILLMRALAKPSVVSTPVEQASKIE